MPIIAAFLGMIVRVYHSDHNPPHIHVQYGDYEAIFEIKSGRILYGKLSPRLQRLLSEWLRSRRHDIMKAWDDAQAHHIPRRVKPLD